MARLWKPGYYERGGNTKTHGIVRAELTVRDDLPSTCGGGSSPSRAHLSRLGPVLGPGPYITRDIDDVGFMSMSIKLMGVPGRSCSRTSRRRRT